MRWLDIINETPRGQILPTKNVEGENVFALADAERSSLNGQTAYHVTTKAALAKIQASGGLKPRADKSGEREFALDTIKIGKDWRTPKGIWISTGKPDWIGDVVLTLTIEPSDTVFHAYSPTGHIMLANPVPMDRITVTEK